jgi:hypothetical protein
MDYYHSGLAGYVEAAVAIFLVLSLTGLIGPKKLQHAMRWLNTWLALKATLIFPIDPYKPIAPAVKQGFKDFWPTPERWRNSILILLGAFAISILIAIATGLVVLLRH